MDRTDEVKPISYPKKCIHAPAFRCEESSCYPIPGKKPPFPCGDGECVGPHEKCNNNRHLYAQMPILTTGMKEPCWQAMHCLTGQQERNECSCVEGVEIPCISMAAYRCPLDYFTFPEIPIVSNHVYLVYKRPFMNDEGNTIEPSYICFGKDLCTVPNTIIYEILNRTCIDYDEEIGVMFSSYPGWNTMLKVIQTVFSSICASPLTECPHPSLYRCNDTSKCISIHRLRDGVSDCQLNDDEKYTNTCSLNSNNMDRFRCSDENLCLSMLTIQNGIIDCLNGEDEMSHFERHLQNHIIIQYVCDGIQHFLPIEINGRNETDETECDLWKGNNSYTHCNSVWNCPKGEDELDSMNSNGSLSSDQIPTYIQPVAAVKSERTISYKCHRGIGVFVRTSNESVIKCMCPPSTYGYYCQYQSQRVSLTVQVRSATDWLSMFTFVFLLITDQNEIESYDYRYYSAITDCILKWNIYLLYRTRPKDASKNYSVRIYVYKREATALEYRTSWHYPLHFSFLPVHRMAVQITIPSLAIITRESICPLDCNKHGSCIVANSNTAKKIFLCRCHPGWYGIYCQYAEKPSTTCSCAPNSLCISSYPVSICVCPLGRGGPKCWIKTDVLQDMNIYKSTETNILVHSQNRCSSINDLFNSSLVLLHRIRRIKYYHWFCQKHHDLMCFYDKIDMCLCNDKREAVCIILDQNTRYICQDDSGNCENGGECFQDDLQCPSRAICRCPACFHGSKCQFSTKGFSLSLDNILGYQIRPSPGLTNQLNVVKFSLVLVVVMFFIGTFSGIFSAMVFIQKNSRKVGSVDFLLRTCVNYGDWLNASVAIERALTVIQGIHFDKEKSKRIAKWAIVLLFFIIATTNLHDPLNRRLITDEDEQRTWCIIRYSSLAETYNSVSQIVHFSLPFALNIISSLIIIVNIARARSRTQKEQTLKKHIRKQLALNKHLFISPIILVLLAVPGLIISLISGCMKTDREPWLPLIGYFISFVPSLLVFVVFVLPSTTYKAEFKNILMKMYHKVR
ncbi:unnamed protein product [Adineta steineri]|nr:unnamed protein product [Adineta steineri]